MRAFAPVTPTDQLERQFEFTCGVLYVHRMNVGTRIRCAQLAYNTNRIMAGRSAELQTNARLLASCQKNRILLLTFWGGVCEFLLRFLTWGMGG